MKFPKTGLPFVFPFLAVPKTVQPEFRVHGDQGSLAGKSVKKNLEFLKIESSLNNDHCLHLLRGRKRGGKAAKVVAHEIHVVLSSSHLQQQGYLMEITYWKFKWVWLPFHVQVTARLLLINLATSLVQEGEPFHLPE